VSDPAGTAVTVAKPVLEELWAFLRKKVFAKADKKAIDSAFREILSLHPDEDRIASLLGDVKDTNRKEYRAAARAASGVTGKKIKRARRAAKKMSYKRAKSGSPPSRGTGARCVVRVSKGKDGRLRKSFVMKAKK
jgi:hypothetical protein